MKRLVSLAVIGLASLVGAAQAQAPETIRIAVPQDVNTVDPHFHSLASNNGLALSVFDGIVRPDAQGNPAPGLAESWEIIDDTTWEFILREGVTFHDGTPISIEDIIFSFERASTIPDSPSGGFARSLAGKTVEAVDDRVFRILTETPMPTMLDDLVYVMIVSKAAAEGTTRSEFNSGEAAIGTGPYEFVSWTPGQEVVLRRNENYWGGVPAFETVIIQPIASDPTRIAALLAGDVDVIAQVPSDDLARLESQPEIQLFQEPGRRIMYLHMDQFRDITPFAEALDGSEIPNPLLDRRVRLAISHAINRDLVVSGVLNGAGIVASHYAPPTSPAIGTLTEPTEYNLELARELLAEAGYPDGFRFTLHGTNDAYPKAAEMAEALGQMMTRAGIQTQVVTMPSTIFFRRSASGGPDGEPEFSMNLQGCCSSSLAPDAPLTSLMYSPDVTDGLGNANRGRYSNPELDALIEAGLASMDLAERNAIIAEAMDLAVTDMAVIPLLFHSNVWATRGDIGWVARAADVTVASDAVALD